jgi:hypothetical protein
VLVRPGLLDDWHLYSWSMPVRPCLDRPELRAPASAASTPAGLVPERWTSHLTALITLVPLGRHNCQRSRAGQVPSIRCRVGKPLPYDLRDLASASQRSSCNCDYAQWSVDPERGCADSAGNPVYARAPDGTHLLYFTGVPQPISGCPPQRNCSIGANSTPPLWSGHQCPGYSKRGSHGQEYRGGDGINLAHSRSLDGPWTVAMDVPLPGIDTTNPGPTVLPNGTVLLAFKSVGKYNFTSELCPSRNPKNAVTCMSLGLVAAPSWSAW